MGLHRWNAIGNQNRLGFRLGHHPIIPGKHFLNDGLGLLRIRCELLRSRRRCLHQHFHIAPVIDHMHEGADSMTRSFICRDAGLGEHPPGGRNRLPANPTCQHIAFRSLCGVYNRLCCIGGGSGGHRCVHGKQRIHARRIDQNIRRCSITFSRGIADDVHRIGARPVDRQHGVKGR